jgi:hypothetical protein
MSTQLCKFEVPDATQPEIKLCSVCGFRMKSKFTPELCRNICGRQTRKGNGRNMDLGIKQEAVDLVPMLRFGDLAELVLFYATLKTPSEVRQAKYLYWRNKLLGSRFVRDWLGLAFTLGKTCDCKARRTRWNTYGGIIPPIWLRRFFPKRRYAPASMLPTTEAAPITATPVQSCPSCLTIQNSSSNGGPAALESDTAPARPDDLRIEKIAGAIPGANGEAVFLVNGSENTP